MTQVFAILNVTPDSFSDGGRFDGLEAAFARGIELHAQGADVVDVGGESTRPGAARVPVAEEQERVIPVVRELVAAGVPVSVDTMNAMTARAAARAGASVINDVSGGLADPDMYAAVAEIGLDYIAMHWRGHSQQMGDLAVYSDVVADVRAELQSRLDAMAHAGIALERIVLDPGLSFAKTAEHNWRLLAHLADLEALGHRVLVGASRKRFLAPLLPDDATTDDRDAPTSVVTALAAQAGVWGVRVHDVVSTRAALGVLSAWENGRTA